MKCGDPLLARLLLLAGYDPNFDMNVTNLNTFLHISAWIGNFEIVQLLLIAGANKHARSALGVTPCQLARDKGFNLFM